MEETTVGPATTFALFIHLLAETSHVKWWGQSAGKRDILLFFYAPACRQAGRCAGGGNTRYGGRTKRIFLKLNVNLNKPSLYARR